jgi:peptide/nickel transport system permease protein
MAAVIALLAWMWPTRTIRAQVLTLRERSYVEIARLSGMGDIKIIFKELLPNLLPYLAASFVGAVSAAILAAVGLEALGLGPQTDPTLGMTIFWGMYYGAILRGMWWWWVPPMAAISYVFIGLFMISWGLDELANPRLRRAA